MTDNQDPSSFYKKASTEYNKLQNTASLTQEQISAKRRIFISLLISMGILQTLYLNLAAFLPDFAEEHYPWNKEF